MDLDIGCRAHPGPLMHFQTILPVTKPVGLSNDLIFSAPKTAFMDLVIHSLDAFNHEWLWMNYPAVMFSTGPMFISALYGAWYRSLGNAKPGDLEHAQRVRILPKSLYGKNAPPEEVPHSFFWHYYGSSWHASDAGFVGFVSGLYGRLHCSYTYELTKALHQSWVNMDTASYLSGAHSSWSASATSSGASGHSCHSPRNSKQKLSRSLSSTTLLQTWRLPINPCGTHSVVSKVDGSAPRRITWLSLLASPPLSRHPHHCHSLQACKP